MGSYPTKWLNCRYPFDADARNIECENKLLESLSGKKNLRIIDIGAGNGSNLKYYSGRFTQSEEWTCIEIDPVLCAELEKFHKEERSVKVVRASALDYNEYGSQSDIVLANALFDLFSIRQFEEIVENLITKEVPMLFTLNYVNTAFQPKDPFDSRVVQLYHDHMQRQQDFGRAMGPTGPGLMVDSLSSLVTENGERMSLITGHSDWKVLPGDVEMLRFLIGFIYEAVSEIHESEEFTEWVKMRYLQIDNGQLSITVNHQDIGCI